MKVTAYDFGKCGLTNLFYAGTIKFDTTGASSGVEIFEAPQDMIITGAVAEVTTAFNAGTTNVLTVGADCEQVDIRGSGCGVCPRLGELRLNLVTLFQFDFMFCVGNIFHCPENKVRLILEVNKSAFAAQKRVRMTCVYVRKLAGAQGQNAKPAGYKKS